MTLKSKGKMVNQPGRDCQNSRSDEWWWHSCWKPWFNIISGRKDLLLSNRSSMRTNTTKGSKGTNLWSLSSASVVVFKIFVVVCCPLVGVWPRKKGSKCPVHDLVSRTSRYIAWNKIGRNLKFHLIPTYFIPYDIHWCTEHLFRKRKTLLNVKLVLND